MQCNVGKTDRLVRIIAGIAIISAGFYYQSWWGAIGVVPIITGALRWCPPYEWLGIDTNKN
jgi:sulfite exporter TauE/SafE